MVKVVIEYFYSPFKSLEFNYLILKDLKVKHSQQLSCLNFSIELIEWRASRVCVLSCSFIGMRAFYFKIENRRALTQHCYT